MIKMEKVTLGYGKARVLDNIDLEIKKGEFVGIIGPSGAGKTTLLMSVVGGVRVFSGDFKVLGFDMRNIKKRDLLKLRQQIGIIFQGYNLVNRLNVLDNVMSGMLKSIPLLRAILKYYTDEELAKAKELMEVVDILKHANKRCDELSGGQKQRVAIARALAGDPKIMLADEPVSALDPNNAKRVMDILKKINEIYGVTILVNLHNLDIAKKYCRRIIGVNHGSIVFDGESADLSDEVVRRIYGSEEAVKQMHASSMTLENP